MFLTTPEKVVRLSAAKIPNQEIGSLLGIPIKEVQSYLSLHPISKNQDKLIIQRIEAGRSNQQITQEFSITNMQVAAYRAHVTRGTYSKISPIPYGWKNQPFPQSKGVDHLILPNGTILKDACVWHNFMQTELKLDPTDIWNRLLQLPPWSSNQAIPHRPTGDKPHWIPGNHKALNYRGNGIKRDKIWCQTDYHDGLCKYGYSGWQWKISYATHDVKYVVPVREVSEALNSGLSCKPNHFIVTKYKDGKDNIGFHSDKTADFEPNSYFIVLKLGDPRPFEFREKVGKKAKVLPPFYSEELSAGTAIFCRANSSDGLDSNNLIQHGVPPIVTQCGESGSIVCRCISTTVPWNEVARKIKISNIPKKKKP